MSKLYNHFNAEELFFGKVYEIPKEVKPFNLIKEADELIFKSITKIYVSKKSY